MDCSVVIPTSERNPLLARVLAGLREQTVPAGSFEVLVVEDGPADSAREIVEASGFRYLEQPHAPGPAGARNLGIEHAQGRIVLLLGDDTIPAPDLIDRHLRAHTQHPGGAVLGHIAWHPDCGVTPFMEHIGRWGGQFSFGRIRDPEACGYGFFYSSNISLEARWLALERFDERFPWATTEDIELGYRLEKRGLVVRYRAEAQVFHHHYVSRQGFGARMQRAGRCVHAFVGMHPQDPTLPGRWLPFARVPGAYGLVGYGGLLVSRLPLGPLSWYALVRAHYALGVRRAMRDGDGISACAGDASS